jgi:hypothetical protein
LDCATNSAFAQALGGEIEHAEATVAAEKGAMNFGRSPPAESGSKDGIKNGEASLTWH